MSTRAPLLTALALLLLLAAAPAPAAEAIARVGSAEVSADELRAWLDSLGEPERSALARDPALLPQAVRAHLAGVAVLREAQARRWDQRPAVQAQLRRLRDEALAELYLQSVSEPPASYPGEAELKSAYEANLAAFAVPRQVRVAQVFVAAGRPGQEEERRRRAEELAARLRAKGADFAAVARAESEEQEAAQRGGELGWLTEEQLVPAIRGAVAALAREAVSEPLRLEDGWHIVKLLDQRPPSTRPLAEVRELLVSRLRAERARANRQAWLAQLLEKDPPVVNELALGRLLPGK